MEEIKKSEFKASFKTPSFGQFCRSKSKQSKSPVHKFFDWIVKNLDQPVDSKKFTIDVSSVWLSMEDGAAFKEALAQWLKRRDKWRSITSCRNDVEWLWLDIGPATFHYGLPSWAEKGRVYIRKDWKKPPNVRIESGNQFFVNGIKATKREVEALKKKYGTGLRVVDNSRY